MILTRDRVIDGLCKNFRSRNSKVYESWTIYFGIDVRGRKIRRYAPTREKALKKIDEFFATLEANSSGTDRLAVDHGDAAAALKMLREAGFVNVTLARCAKRYIEIVTSG